LSLSGRFSIGFATFTVLAHVQNERGRYHLETKSGDQVSKRGVNINVNFKVTVKVKVNVRVNVNFNVNLKANVTVTVKVKVNIYASITVKVT